ncbi:Cyclin-dependent kinase C-1 [Vitis vinifera]|uniref:Cyclin-dependent kinase C-1 n=1 Tax=Vitis vinifera TaxID=29760 RepID=A0A438E2C0_VITVI|nr:Cyclin-dependent kinase C-1 [Vitis vinifera]
MEHDLMLCGRILLSVIELEVTDGIECQVYMAREIKTGEIVALKKIRMDNEREGFPITAIREIKILKKLHHENVIKLKEIVTSPGIMVISTKEASTWFLNTMDHDLTGLADRPGMRFSVPQIKCYMRQLLTGLHYCHVNQVLHRDIKGSNLLIDNEGNLKLADFGLPGKQLNSHGPPELLLGTTRYGPAVDMWSVGCIFAELLHGKPIFPGKDEVGRSFVRFLFTLGVDIVSRLILREKDQVDYSSKPFDDTAKEFKPFRLVDSLSGKDLRSDSGKTLA